jgi:hypothetical protein
MTIRSFSGNFTQQEAISDTAIEAAVEVLRSGRIHRYNTTGNELAEVALLEQKYATWQESEYCLACASGGYAMSIALKAAGLKVLTTYNRNNGHYPDRYYRLWHRYSDANSRKIPRAMEGQRLTKYLFLIRDQDF